VLTSGRSEPRGAPAVLHVITRLIVGGAQENTLETAAGLDPRGFRSEILCGPESGPEGSLLDEARARGVRVSVEPALLRELHPRADLQAVLRIARFVRRGGFRVLHTHSSKAGILGRFAARLAGVPHVVHTVHGWSFHARQPAALRALYVRLERAAARITDTLVAVSERDVEKGLAAGIGSADRYRVIRSAVEIDRFARPIRSRSEVRGEWGIPEGAPVIGSVTRLVPQKAPLDFVTAAAAIAGARPEARFVLVGDGPERDAVEQRVRALGLGGRVLLLGLRRDVPDLLAAFDAFLLTSLWEGMPRVLVQAVAAGVPVVATAVDGCAELVRDGETGLLVPPGRPEAAARAALRLLGDPDLATRIRRAARPRIEREFGLERMLGALEEVYRGGPAPRTRAFGAEADESACQRPPPSD
jgi:glycosyltransferase involved in cell wall biosynthesis